MKLDYYDVDGYLDDAPSTDSWTKFVAWVETQDAQELTALFEMIEHGHTESVDLLKTELNGLKCPDDGSEDSIEGMRLQMLAAVKEADAVFIISGE